LIRPGENKRQWHLLPLDVIEIVVDVFQAGAEKHAPFGWKRVEDWRVQYEDALMRHWAAYKRGETWEAICERIGCNRVTARKRLKKIEK